MSKQLAVSSAFSIFAVSALALLAPGSVRVSDLALQTGMTIAVAAPVFAARLPFAG